MGSEPNKIGTEHIINNQSRSKLSPALKKKGVRAYKKSGVKAFVLIILSTTSQITFFIDFMCYTLCIDI